MRGGGPHGETESGVQAQRRWGSPRRIDGAGPGGSGVEDGAAARGGGQGRRCGRKPRSFAQGYLSSWCCRVSAPETRPRPHPGSPRTYPTWAKGLCGCDWGSGDEVSLGLRRASDRVSLREEMGPSEDGAETGRRGQEPKDACPEPQELAEAGRTLPWSFWREPGLRATRGRFFCSMSPRAAALFSHSPETPGHGWRASPPPSTPCWVSDRVGPSAAERGRRSQGEGVVRPPEPS